MNVSNQLASTYISLLADCFSPVFYAPAGKYASRGSNRGSKENPSRKTDSKESPGQGTMQKNSHTDKGITSLIH